VTDSEEIEMARIMDGEAVREIRREMDRAKTAKSARQTMARHALRRANLTDGGRAEWEKEMAA